MFYLSKFQDMAVQYKYTQKDLCNSCLTWSDLQQNGHSWLTEVSRNCFLRFKQV